MLGEAAAAVVVAAVALWLVLQPLLRPRAAGPRAIEPEDPEATPKGIALAALKEIEFDRETGKLSEADYQFLKARYTASALEAIRAESADGGAPDVEAPDVEVMIAARVRALRAAGNEVPAAPPACRACGPRPEPDAVFCSTCGARLASSAACARCGAVLPPDGRFCERCGQQVAA